MEILGRRDDGFHTLVSVFQAITVADELECRLADALELRCEPPLPIDDNLVIRAARLLQSRSGVTGGASLTLRKRIPIAAGLGGGSADAAAALAGLSRLWGLGRANLAALAEQLGSDVPFFLGTGTALVEGRGEVIRPLPPPSVQRLVLVRPRVALSTRDVFTALRQEEWSDGAATRALAQALRDGRGLPESLLRNDVQATAERCCLPLATTRQRLGAAGLRPHLTGTGPTLFLLANSAVEAARIARTAQAPEVDVIRCRTLRTAPLRLQYLP